MDVQDVAESAGQVLAGSLDIEEFQAYEDEVCPAAAHARVCSPKLHSA